MKRRAVVAGHLCLDIIPIFENPPAEAVQLFSPGHLFPVASTLFSGGGAVANTGGALVALGIDTRLVARIGDDGFGATVATLLARRLENAVLDLKRAAGESTSYSLVISSPRFDRIFFHQAGANDGFSAAEVGAAQLEDRELFHFGYPPAMRRMYENDGEELLRLFRRVKEAGLTTSLDLCYPQTGSLAAQANWRRILERVLPEVDLFLPSLGELQFVLSGCRETTEQVTIASLREAADWVLSRGCPLCALKIGADGLYLRTTENEERIAAMGRCAPRAPGDWADCELLEPCFDVDAKGTTGAGDVTIAGFLAAVLRGLSLEEATRMALAAGAASVESVDAAAALPGWDELLHRIEGGWPRRARRISL